MGVMQIMAVYLVQQAVVTELHISSAPNLPNVFLIDITNDEIDGMRALLKSQKSVTSEPELLPVVSSRIIAIDGVPANQAKLKNFPKRMLQSINLTWSESAAAGDDDGRREVVGLRRRRSRWWRSVSGRRSGWV